MIGLISSISVTSTSSKIEVFAELYKDDALTLIYNSKLICYYLIFKLTIVNIKQLCYLTRKWNR